LKTTKPIGIRNLLMKRNLITIGIVITGILSIIMILLTYYGSYSGNFIAVVDSDEKISSIVLSSSRYFTEASPRLYADSVKDTPPLVFDDMKIEEAVFTDGNYFDPEFKYFAYSFYIMNNGDKVETVQARYLVAKVDRNADEAIRVIIVRNDDIDNLSTDNLRVYKKKDTVETRYNPNDPEAIDFQDESKGEVFSEMIENFQPGDIIKYTVIIYLEGNDPDCRDSLSGGLIKMTFRFKIFNPEDEEEV